MMNRFRFHILGLPHTATNRSYNACAYTQKVVKFIEMMGRRGHECIHYGNEGSFVLPDPSGREPVGRLSDHVEILTEEERAGWFGAHDRQKLYDLKWDPNEPYWRLFNERCITALRPRIRRGDFILTLAGNCSEPVARAFPGSHTGIVQDAAMVEYGIGYYGTFSRYRCYESHAHREWCMGRFDEKGTDNDSAVIPNYFDLDDFRVDPEVEARLAVTAEPYYLYCGRFIREKGIDVVADTTEALDARVIFCGQGNLELREAESKVHIFGHATIEERAVLMSRAIATIMPTHYREPFGGVAVESQLCGTPTITTDHGAFVETVGTVFRCASHREFVEAGRRAADLAPWQRAAMKRAAEVTWGLDAVAPLYERYFQRLTDRWKAGWYEMEPVDPRAL